MIIKLPSSNDMRFVGYVCYRYPRVVIGHLQRVAVLAYMDTLVAAKTNQASIATGRYDYNKGSK